MREFVEFPEKSGMSKEDYLNMKDQLGEEPDPDEMPWELEDFCWEAQKAYEIAMILPDRYVGMSGTYIGKDLSGLSDIMEILGVRRPCEKKNVLVFLMEVVNALIRANQRRQKRAQNKGKSARVKRG